MNDSDRLTLEFETLVGAGQQAQPSHWDSASAVPTLKNVLRMLSPVPRDALFLGVANDRLPVLLNLRDPVPGPVLIIGDPSSGKTRLLQTISQAVDLSQDTGNIRYTVLTDHVHEWDRSDQSPVCEGILAFQQALTANYLNSLVEWAHASNQYSQYVLLLVDGLEDLVGDSQLHQAFRWLLLRGPSRHIWPIVTLDPAHGQTASQWLGAFRTRLFGRMAGETNERIELLSGRVEFSFKDLRAGAQFAMRAGGDWLPFWLPALD